MRFTEVLNIGIWCNKLWNSRLVWDQAKKVSSSLLKYSTLSESIFLTVTGRRLKILAPFTEKDDSLAPLTAASALGSTCYGITVLPFLSLVEKDTLYPLTIFWYIFQRNIIIAIIILSVFYLTPSPTHSRKVFQWNQT